MTRIENHFANWEKEVFGYGYGDGETPVLRALKTFFDSFEHKYDYRQLETLLGAESTWFLINALCRAKIIEYGTSPRFAWLTPQGDELQSFVKATSLTRLIAVCTEEDSTGCSPASCNCGPNGYEKGLVCNNPFWRPRGT